MGDRAIAELVQKLAGTHLKDELHLAAATVTAVDQAARTCTCTPIGGKAVTEIDNVMLMPEVDDGLLLIPALNSTVLVLWSTKNVPYIAMWSQLQKAIIVTLDGIQLQGGELGGLPVSQYLVSRLNLVETALNEALTALSLPPVVETVITDIENKSITQGV